MQTIVTARHCAITDELRARAVSVVERLGHFATRPLESTVVFDAEGLERTAELRLHVAHGEVFVATGEGPDHRSALDRAEERLRRQLEKKSKRARQARARRGTGDAAAT